MMHRLKTMLGAGLALSAALVLACSQGSRNDASSVSQAETIPGSNPTISTTNASDPSARVFDGKLYVYTSSDFYVTPYPMVYPDGKSNYFPMKTTYVHTLERGKAPGVTANWTSTAILQETDISWVDANTYHLWAPDAIRGVDGKYYLYAPDLVNMDTTVSHIGVWRSSHPAGPFSEYLGMVTVNGSTNGYQSDPAPLVRHGRFGDTYYLLFANGDYNSTTPVDISCGGISISRLRQAGSGDMLTATDAHEIIVDGIPTSTQPGCATKPGQRAYMEGASLYYLTKAADGVDSGTRPWYLLFPFKPDDRNSVIAYARASDPMGNFTYEGIIMEASDTEWTNQASIVKWGGDWLLFYHDDLHQDSGGNYVANRNRISHGECISFDSTGAIKNADGSALPVPRSAAGLGCATNYPREYCTPNYTVAPLPNTQSGNFNSTNEVCFTLDSAKVLHFNCSNMAGRTVTVNGKVYQSAECINSAILPVSADGKYYFDVSAGGLPYASIAFWNE